MNFQEFNQSLSASAPPPDFNIPLQALWHDAKGAWHTAHALVQNHQDAHSCRVHAFLHREEGDLGNANYWYKRAGKTMPNGSLRQEWETIVKELID